MATLGCADVEMYVGLSPHIPEFVFKLLLTAVLGVLTMPNSQLSAATLAVGGCRPELTSYSTIRAAVTAASPGSVILVCSSAQPYAESVIITKPLTLQGVQDAIGNNPTIRGGTIAAISRYGTVYTQILVENPFGPVDIRDITIDGASTGVTCPPPQTAQPFYIAGILYLNSAGTVRRVSTRGQAPPSSMTFSCGTGIWLENDDGMQRSVTVWESSVHDIQGLGIFAFSNAPATPTLTANVKSNLVSDIKVSAITLTQTNGSVTNNTTSGGAWGLVLSGLLPYKTGVTVSKNTFMGATAAGLRLLSGGNLISGNKFFTNIVGISIEAPGNSILKNHITRSNTAVNVGCDNIEYRGPNTVINNILSDAVIGIMSANRIDDILSPNVFSNVQTLTMRCSRFADLRSITDSFTDPRLSGLD